MGHQTKKKKQKAKTTNINRSIDRFENVNQASKYAFMFGSLNVAKMRLHIVFIPFFEPTKMLNWHFLHCMANCSFWKGFSRKIICKRKQMKIFRKFRSLTFDTFSDGMLCFFFYLVQQTFIRCYSIWTKLNSIAYLNTLGSMEQKRISWQRKSKS